MVGGVVIGITSLIHGIWIRTWRLGFTLRLELPQLLARLLEASAVQGRAPKVGLVIRIEEAFMHCAKALVRSKLWDPESRVDRSRFASYPEMLRDHVEGLTDEENERQSKIMAERGLY